jgi:hypothetical protein
VRRDTLLEAKTLDGRLARGLAQPGSKPRVADDLIEGRPERRLISGGHEQARLAIRYDFGEGSGARGDDRTAACHRLQDREPAGLLPEARMHEHVGSSQQIWDVVTESQKLGSRCDAEAGAQLSQTWLLRAIPNNQEPRIVRPQPSEGANQKLNTLVPNQIGHGDYPNFWSGAAEVRIGTEAVQVDAIVYRARFSPGEPETPNAPVAHVAGHSGKTGDSDQRGPVEQGVRGPRSGVRTIDRRGKVVHEEDPRRPCRIGHQGDWVARGKQVQVQHVEAARQVHNGSHRVAEQLFQASPGNSEAAQPTGDLGMQRFASENLEGMPATPTLRGQAEQPHLKRAQLSGREVHEQTNAQGLRRRHMLEDSNFHTGGSTVGIGIAPQGPNQDDCRGRIWAS